jgi:type IV pilus assembly protein PilO
MTKKLQQQLIFIVLIFAGLSYVYFGYILKPINSRFQDAQTKLREAESKLSEMKLRALELPKLQSEMMYLEQEVSDLEKLLPKEKQIPELIRTITKAAQQFGIKMQNIAPGPEAPQANFSELPFRMILEGNYHSFARFLAELAQGQRIFNYRDLVFTGRTASKEDPNTIMVSFNLIAFIFKQ